MTTTDTSERLWEASMEALCGGFPPLPAGAAGVLAGEPDRFRRSVLYYAYRRTRIPRALRRPLRGTPKQIAARRAYEGDLAWILMEAGIE